ncbi:hypothetical protein [Brevundimonas subvibrioides]|uniref:hypothetical protein n=1 Tax=Brevundimonas subvibrioides TaxID=74313 RepID=UPI0005A1FAD5|nr:hypothetical protein [Brevundimonas subvibrioides]
MIQALIARLDGRSWLLLLVLVVLTGAAILSFPFILLFAAMSGMAADSCIDWPIKLFILTALTSPVAVLAALVVGWKSFLQRKEKFAWLALGALALWPLVLVGSVEMGARVC